VSGRAPCEALREPLELGRLGRRPKTLCQPRDAIRPGRRPTATSARTHEEVCSQSLDRARLGLLISSAATRDQRSDHMGNAGIADARRIRAWLNEGGGRNRQTKSHLFASFSFFPLPQPPTTGFFDWRALKTVALWHKRLAAQPMDNIDTQHLDRCSTAATSRNPPSFDSLALKREIETAFRFFFRVRWRFSLRDTRTASFPRSPRHCLFPPEGRRNALLDGVCVKDHDPAPRLQNRGKAWGHRHPASSRPLPDRRDTQIIVDRWSLAERRRMRAAGGPAASDCSEGLSISHRKRPLPVLPEAWAW